MNAKILPSLMIVAGLSVFAQDGPPPAWQNWRYSRPVEAAFDADTGFAQVKLPFEALGKTREDSADIRLIDSAGNEVPFILQTRTGSSSTEWRSSVISEIGYVAGEYTQLTVDAGGEDERHNSVHLATPEPEFFALVEIAVSEDQTEWRIVRERAPVYRFQRERLSGIQTVDYPETRSQWLRVRISDGARQFPVASCQVAYTITEEPELEAAGPPLTLMPSSSRTEDDWEAELDLPSPLAAARFETSQPEFHRPVVVHAGPNRDTFSQVGAGAIYRYRSDDQELVRSRLQVRFDESRGQRWRVAVVNRNDAPLDGLQVRLMTVPRRIVFRPQPGHSYRILYGNSRASAPSYDLEKIIPRAQRDTAPEYPLGPEQENPNYISPEPWTERNPAVVWGALILAVAVLGWLAIKSLRKEEAT